MHFLGSGGTFILKTHRNKFSHFIVKKNNSHLNFEIYFRYLIVILHLFVSSLFFYFLTTQVTFYAAKKNKKI